MSRNNLVIVVCDKRGSKKIKPRYYIFPNMNADCDWNYSSLKKKIADPLSKWTLNQGKALIIAHRIDSKIKTEYGVRIMFLHY